MLDWRLAPQKGRRMLTVPIGRNVEVATERNNVRKYREKQRKKAWRVKIKPQWCRGKQEKRSDVPTAALVSGDVFV